MSNNMGTQSANVYWTGYEIHSCLKMGTTKIFVSLTMGTIRIPLNSNKFLQKSELLYHISNSNARPLSHTKAPYERFVKYNLHHGLSFCFFEDLIFWKVNCRIKSWAEDVSVCKSKPGGDSDFGILMRKESYGEPTDGEDRSAEGSKAIGQAEIMWTFLSKPAQGPIHVNPINPGEIQFDRTLPCCMGGRAPTIAKTFVLRYTWRRRHRFRASPTFQ